MELGSTSMLLLVLSSTIITNISLMFKSIKHCKSGCCELDMQALTTTKNLGTQKSSTELINQK